MVSASFASTIGRAARTPCQPPASDTATNSDRVFPDTVPRDKKNDMNGMICYLVIHRGYISKRSWILITTIRYRIRQGLPRPMQILAGAKP